MTKPQRGVWAAERRSLQSGLCGRSPASADSHPSLPQRQRWGRELGHLLPLPSPAGSEEPGGGGGGGARNGTRCKLRGYPLRCRHKFFHFPEQPLRLPIKPAGGSRPPHAVEGALIPTRSDAPSPPRPRARASGDTHLPLASAGQIARDPGRPIAGPWVIMTG